jgi:hypothetical protein
MFDVLNVISQSDKNMHIFVVVAFISTKMLLAVRAFCNDVNDQIIRRPFVMLICACYENRQWCATFIHQKMNFAA